MLVRDKDYLDVCNPDGKVPSESFVSVVCRQCKRPECVRSSYEDTATQQKILKHEKLMAFTEPETVPLSPLSEYPPEAAPTEVLPEGLPPLKLDPWAAPSTMRVLNYAEISTPEQDPWSPQYTGPRELRVKPGATITVGAGPRKGK